MLAEAERSLVRLADAVEAMRVAQDAVAKLDRVTWGGPVDKWHTARDELRDAIDTFGSYWLTEPRAWWQPPR
jgi:hypothetical protein